MLLTNEQNAKMIRMKAAVKRSELYVAYWIAQATTGATIRRVISHGNRQLTSEEKIDEAFETALCHIQLIEDISNNMAYLIEGREDMIMLWPP